MQRCRFGGPGGRRARTSAFGFGADTAAAAKYLGLDESDLRAKLRGGQSLADVAKAQGKDVQGLRTRSWPPRRPALDKAVSDKKLTQSQADDIARQLKAHVDDLVNAKPRRPPAAARGAARGPRFFFGP